MIVHRVVLAIACIVIPLLGMAQTASASASAEPAPGVVGPTWVLRTLQAPGGQPEQIADQGPTIIFDVGGGVTGSGGCNRFNGTYTADLSGKLTFSPLAATKIGCAGPISDLETRYFALLQEVTGYKLDNDTLRLTFAGADRQLVYRRSIANQAQVTGTVTYLQRIALPADAVLRVQLLNTSRQDAPAAVLAEQVGPAGGTVSPPFAFSLGYDPLQIVASNTYAVQASIEVGGQVRFRSTRAYLVITQGRPTTDVAIIVDQLGTGGVPSSMPQGGGGGMAGRAETAPWLPIALALGGLAVAFRLGLWRARRRLV